MLRNCLIRYLSLDRFVRLNNTPIFFQSVLSNEHRARKITNIREPTPRIIKELLESFIIERDPAMRKVIATKLLQFDGIEDGLSGIQDLAEESLVKTIDKKILEEALQWRVPY